MKTLLTIHVWLFVPLLMVEAVVCKGGARVPATAARTIAAVGSACAGRVTFPGDRAEMVVPPDPGC